MSYADFTARYTRYTQTSRSLSEAFKDADYACALTRPKSADYDGFWGFIGALAFAAMFGYCFWLTISH